jgi:hypothetical protein
VGLFLIILSISCYDQGKGLALMLGLSAVAFLWFAFVTGRRWAWYALVAVQCVLIVGAIGWPLLAPRIGYIVYPGNYCLFTVPTCLGPLVLLLLDSPRRWKELQKPPQDSVDEMHSNLVR